MLARKNGDISELPARPEGCFAQFGDPVFPLVITCEHGGNRIPVPYRDLFRGQQRQLASHRGYDPGALVMGRGAGGGSSRRRWWSPRLAVCLVDLNRSVGHPRLHCEAIRKAACRGAAADAEGVLSALSGKAERLVRPR